ncbi:MAG: putative LysR-family transcriptional regulator [Thermoleophilia bacterium]|nr:putative LysR-family transcriptional regulator [Thermoleophilia bacterium]
MDPRRILTFRAVAHEGSFSRAARALSLSQPSVSHQIALLETEAGVRLIDRQPGGLHLTPAGDVLLEHADRLAWRLDLARAQVGEIASRARIEIRVGSFPTALAGYLPAAVVQLRETRPEARVVLSEVTPSTIETRFLSGEFDIAISYQDDGDTRREFEGAERIELLHDTFLLGLPPNHPLANDEGRIDLSKLSDDDWIVPSLDGYLVNACRAAGFEPRVASVTYDPLATRGLIARGLGVGFVPELLGRDFHEVALRPVAGVRHRQVFALLPPGRRHPLASAVIDALTMVAPHYGIVDEETATHI